jgi:GNAT superfamily N-acetyltransferase
MTMPPFVTHAATSVDDEARDVVLRPEDMEDAEFLSTLYVSVRWHELMVTDWPDKAKLAFLTSQFQLQTRQYAANYPGMERWIVEHGGMAIGRFYVLRTKTEWRVVDISLLPEWRGQGIGAGLLGDLGCQTRQQGIPLRLRVERHNPALQLYRRLGFQVIDATGLYWLMECKFNELTGA